jgi:hypothetical protein
MKNLSIFSFSSKKPFFFCWDAHHFVDQSRCPGMGGFLEEWTISSVG